MLAGWKGGEARRDDPPASDCAQVRKGCGGRYSTGSRRWPRARRARRLVLATVGLWWTTEELEAHRSQVPIAQKRSETRLAGSVWKVKKKRKGHEEEDSSSSGARMREPLAHVGLATMSILELETHSVLALQSSTTNQFLCAPIHDI